jgi:hypothetical protein
MPARHDGVLLHLLAGGHRYARYYPPTPLPPPPVACYSTFWLVVIGVKWAFEYYFVIKPLVPPSRALW